MDIKKSPIKDLSQAIALLAKTQAFGDKYYHESLVAKARVYDFTYPKDEEGNTPTDAELKARIITLEEEAKKLVKERDTLQAKLAQIKSKRVVA